MTKEKALNLIANKIVNCVRCPLGNFRSENKYLAVPGEGAANARVMFLGEAPGHSEALTGKPFCGKSGKLLTQLLSELGLKRENFFVTNVLKCRPPENRDPTGMECISCRPFLNLQIKAIQPEYIVCLGKVAALNLLKPDNIDDGIWFKQSLGAFRGRFHYFGDTKVIATYHPSFLLRNFAAEKLFKQDIRMLLDDMRKKSYGSQSQTEGKIARAEVFNKDSFTK